MTFATLNPGHCGPSSGEVKVPDSTARFGGGDSLELALTPEIGFEFSEHAKHVQEGLACRAAGVDGLLGRLESDAALLQCVHDVLQILDAARQAIDPRHNQRVTPAEEIEQRRQLGAAGTAGAARLPKLKPS